MAQEPMVHEYVGRLKAIGITLLEQFTNSRAHHLMLCDHCGHEWSATPVSKTQAFRNYGVNGCPSCHTMRRSGPSVGNKAENLAKLQEHVEIRSEWDGSLAFKGTPEATLVTFYNPKCGHVFRAYPNRLIRSAPTYCTTCGIASRVASMNAGRRE